jgi:uncharacterized protein YdeI (YjbR/CyaY-like superfamily)
VTVKKLHVPADQEYVSARDLNEECLCFGWIDSKPGRVDDEHTALLCTPRKPGSSWSQVNKERFAVLHEQGLVAPAGEQVAQAAQADGSWDRLALVDALEEPPDLTKALDSDTRARAHWDAFPPSARRGILEWILNAKRASTREGRIEETVTKAARNERALAWKPRSG